MATEQRDARDERALVQVVAVRAVAQQQRREQPLHLVVRRLRVAVQRAMHGERATGHGPALVRRAPALGRSQQRLGKHVGAVGVTEQRRALEVVEQLAQVRVDDRVEGEVVERRRAPEEPRVAEHDVVQLVQHQHDELRVVAAVRRDKLRIDPHPRTGAEGDACRRHVGGRLDFEQAEQLGERLLGYRERRPNARGEIARRAPDLAFPPRCALRGLFALGAALLAHDAPPIRGTSRTCLRNTPP